MSAKPARTTRSWTTISLLLALSAALAQGGPTPGAAPTPAAEIAGHPVLGPATAFRSPARDVAERLLGDAEADLTRARSGLAAGLSWNPELEWEGGEDDRFALAEGDWDSEFTASVGWRADARAVARARLTAHRAAIGVLERANGDLRTALSRHIDLHRAHVALTIAQDAAATRAGALATAEEAAGDTLDPAPGAPEPRDLATARLASERADAAAERAARDVASAERLASETGYDVRLAEDRHRDRLAPLALEGWRLWLPDVDPLASPAVTRAALDLAVAEASAQQVRVGSLLDDLRLEASRVGETARLEAMVGFDVGRPTAALDVSLQSATRPAWAVTLSAELRLDGGYARDLTRAEAAVADAAAAWAEAADSAAWGLAEARRAALDAEADVAFAERDLALARLALREAIDAWDGPDGGGPDPAERDRADAALARAAIALERERDGFYRDWSGYLRAAEDYWSAAGVFGGVLAPP